MWVDAQLKKKGSEKRHDLLGISQLFQEII